MVHQPDLSPQRPVPDPASAGDISIQFGVLLCCMAFALTLWAAFAGIPG